MPTNPAGIDLLFSWEGEIGRNVLARILEFEDVARLNAPVQIGKPGPHMVDFIGHELLPGLGKLTALVGVNPEQDIRGYAAIVQVGSVPHEIRPRNPQGFLKFKVGGRTVYAKRVFHPGTLPDPFLMRWIRIIIGEE